MVRIEPGTFRMGYTRKGNWPDDQPVRSVTITRPFLLGITPVTHAQWHDALETTIPVGALPDAPIGDVSWYEATAFANALSAREGLISAHFGEQNTQYNPTANGYRLPTEAEWEYAARAGTDFLYSGSDNPEEVGWISRNARDHVHPVGQLKPNAWGLYDMTGNVWEWCYDRFARYLDYDQVDPVGSKHDPRRVLRGGGWYSNPRYAHVASRAWSAPTFHFAALGFRLARTLEKE